MRYTLAITVPFVQFVSGLPLQPCVISEIEERSLHIQICV